MHLAADPGRKSGSCPLLSSSCLAALSSISQAPGSCGSPEAGLALDTVGGTTTQRALLETVASSRLVIVVWSFLDVGGVRQACKTECHF
jgi:hypothetical protein